MLRAGRSVIVARVDARVLMGDRWVLGAAAQQSIVPALPPERRS